MIARRDYKNKGIIPSQRLMKLSLINRFPQLNFISFNIQYVNKLTIIVGFYLI